MALNPHDASDRTDRAGLPGIVWILTISALLVRLAAVLAKGDFSRATAMEHASLANNLIRGDGFAFGDFGFYGPSSVQSPTYPLFLAGLFSIFGVDAPAAYAVAMGLNVLLGAAAVPLVYLMVRRLRGSHVAAVVAAGMLAFWPTQIVHVLSVQVITLVVLCTVTVVNLWYVATDSGRLLPWLGFGLIGCFAALTEPVFLPPMAAAGLVILVKTNLTFGVRLRNAWVLLGCAIVVIGPWTYRNYVIHDTFMPVKSTFWVNVWKANNPNSSGTDRPVLSEARLRAFRESGVDDTRQYDLLTGEQYALLQGKPEAHREKVFRQWVVEWVRENPGDYLRLCALRLAKTLWWEWDNPQAHQMFYVYPVSRTLLLVGSVAGLFAIRGWRYGFPLLIVGLSLLMYTLTITAARFAMPLEPFQFALTGAAVAAVLSRLYPSRLPAPAVTSYLASRPAS